MENTEFEWDRNCLLLVHTVTIVPPLTDKGIIRELIIKIKNGRTTVPSGLVQKMVKTAGEAEVDMIDGLVNQTIIEELIPAEWKLINVVNCNEEKGNGLKRGDFRGLKLIDQILKVT